MIDARYKMSESWVVIHRESDNKPWIINPPKRYIEAEADYVMYVGMYGSTNTELYLRCPVSPSVTVAHADWMFYGEKEKVHEGGEKG